MSSVCEAFLGDHFYPALAALYERRMGIRFLRFFRPSIYGGWIGREKGRGNLRISHESLLFELSKRLPGRRYLCLLIQMKLIERRVRRGPYTPAGYPSEHYRFELDLRPDPITGMSEHEALLQLGELDQAAVLYGCGMLLSADQVMALPNPADLRLIRPQSVAADGERHFVFFKHPEDRRPLWDGRQPVDAGTPVEWMASGSMPEPLSADDTASLLVEIERFFKWQAATHRERRNGEGEQLSLFAAADPPPAPVRPSVLPDSLMLFEFTDGL